MIMPLIGSLWANAIALVPASKAAVIAKTAFLVPVIFILLFPCDEWILDSESQRQLRTVLVAAISGLTLSHSGFFRGVSLSWPALPTGRRAPPAPPSAANQGKVFALVASSGAEGRIRVI